MNWPLAQDNSGILSIEALLVKRERHLGLSINFRLDSLSRLWKIWGNELTEA